MCLCNKYMCKLTLYSTLKTNSITCKAIFYLKKNDNTIVNYF